MLNVGYFWYILKNLVYISKVMEQFYENKKCLK